MQPCSTCSGGGRRGRTRRRRRRGSPRASLKQRVVDRRRSRERERERRAARWSSATGSSRARPSRVPDAHASAMMPRHLGAAAASTAPPTSALRGVLIDQSAPPTTRVEEDQCSAAPSLSSLRVRAREFAGGGLGRGLGGRGLVPRGLEHGRDRLRPQPADADRKLEPERRRRSHGCAPSARIASTLREGRSSSSSSWSSDWSSASGAHDVVRRHDI